MRNFSRVMTAPWTMWPYRLGPSQLQLAIQRRSLKKFFLHLLPSLKGNAFLINLMIQIQRQINLIKHKTLNRAPKNYRINYRHCLLNERIQSIKHLQESKSRAAVLTKRRAPSQIQSFPSKSRKYKTKRPRKKIKSILINKNLKTSSSVFSELIVSMFFKQKSIEKPPIMMIVLSLIKGQDLLSQSLETTATPSMSKNNRMNRECSTMLAQYHRFLQSQGPMISSL